MVRASASSVPSDSGSLAPRWHTALLVALMLLVALTGIGLQLRGTPAQVPRVVSSAAGARILTQYLPLLLVNWGLTLYVARLFRKRNALPDLLGVPAIRRTRRGVDLAYALGLWLVIEATELLCARLFGVGPNAAVSALLPSTEAERLTWLLVALSVGFCEEVVYRGYLQTQLAAFAGGAKWGIAWQAALFGLAHGEQGLSAALRTAAYGVLFGVLARARGSVLPGVLCHIGVDVAGGLLR